jgi:hypothetical protein
MVTEAYSNPLQTVLNEFKNISPETTNTLIFKSDGQIVAKTQATTEDQTKKLIYHFNKITQQGETIGGIENLTIQAADSQLNIITINCLYLATVSSRAANQEIVKSLTHVLVPTVVQLVDQVASLPKDTQLPQTVQLESPSTAENIFPVEETPQIEPIPELQPPFEPFLPITPINQLMVEKIGGLLVPADTVRIDADVIAKWSDLYDGKQITLLNIEALDGKRTNCKFKPIKEAKPNAKGIIQIPEKILQMLQTEKGKLVMVKPVIDNGEV